MSKKKDFPEDHIFEFNELNKRLQQYVGKTLGEADTKHIFDKTKTMPKITGIAGDVVEQCILGYEADSDQRPDILVDNEPVEVKTTGLRESKSKNKGEEDELEAKEPMSITAVCPNEIVNEKFETSHFWEKAQKMLMVYYKYDSDKTVPASEYARFPIKGYQFHTFNEHDTAILKHDWETVRDFLIEIQNEYENPEEQYPRLSNELRDKLLYIDTAPKWPNPPRFRLKRTVVTAMAQEYLQMCKEAAAAYIDSTDELDQLLHEITEKYKGMTIEQLVNRFQIKCNQLEAQKQPKGLAEQIIVNMFGYKESKLNRIDVFKKAGIIAKSICLTSKGGRTEDMKLCRINFDLWINESNNFEDSFIYDYFMNHSFICIIFKEKDEKQQFKDNIFIGFKRISIDYDFIMKEVYLFWKEIRHLVNDNLLKETLCFSKNGTQCFNKNGVAKTSINLPKSKDGSIFARGSGKDSSCKPECVNGIHMYTQYVWVKGSYMVSQLKAINPGQSDKPQ